MRRFFMPAEAPGWLMPVLGSIREALGDPWGRPLRLHSFAVADLPPATDHVGGVVYVANEAGGATLAFSDGTNWRRAQDRAVVS